MSCRLWTFCHTIQHRAVLIIFLLTSRQLLLLLWVIRRCQQQTTTTTTAKLRVVVVVVVAVSRCQQWITRKANRAEALGPRSPISLQPPK